MNASGANSPKGVIQWVRDFWETTSGPSRRSATRPQIDAATGAISFAQDRADIEGFEGFFKHSPHHARRWSHQGGGGAPQAQPPLREQAAEQALGSSLEDEANTKAHLTSAA